METIKKQMRMSSLLLSVLILFQSCVAYKSKSVSLDQAVNNGDKVKIHTNYNATLEFNKIVFEEGLYYGVKNKKKKIVKTKIDESYIDRIRLKNKSLSTILSIIFPIAIVGGLGYLLLHNAFMWKSNTIDLGF